MNVLLLVIDSLRSQSLFRDDGPRTPFLKKLTRESMYVRRAYATECWTLPTHASMFTGLLPSQHGAHFQAMDYTGSHPTVAELLSAAGHHTEIVTRNSVFDGSIPGILRGFRKRTAIYSDRKPWSPLPLVLAATKPRFREQIMTTGFFHPAQRESREFLRNFARAMLPADHLTLDYVSSRMKRHRKANRPYFLFSNLYDVHAPYSPSRTSILRPFRSRKGCSENIRLHFVLPHLGGHSYLRRGVGITGASRRMLRGRYHDAIELMDAKLEDFWRSAEADGLLDDTMVILTSDHGEAFGEHGLYLHDASVYDTHLHVPLWIHHPTLPPGEIDDVVTTRDLFGLMRSAGLGESLQDTILGRDHREANPIAVAEHFHYPRARDMAPCYRQNLAAGIYGNHKLVCRREGLQMYNLERDPEELDPQPTFLDLFADTLRREGAASKVVSGFVSQIGSWAARYGDVDAFRAGRTSDGMKPYTYTAKRYAYTYTTGRA